MSRIKNIVVSAALAIAQVGEPVLAEQLLSGEASIGRLVSVAERMDQDDQQVVVEYISLANGGA